MLPESLYTTPYLAVDNETTGLCAHKGDRPFAVSMTTNEGEDYYVRFPVDPFTRIVAYTEEIREVLELLTSRSERGLGTIYHNATFDLIQLGYAISQHKGCPVGSLDKLPLRHVYDTIIMAHAANSARDTYALKPLAESLLGIDTEDQRDLRVSVVQARKLGKKLGYNLAEAVEADYHLGDPELCKAYAIQDTQRTMRIFKLFQPLLEETEGPFSRFKDIVEMEHRLMLSVLEMNMRGVRVDPAKIQELKGYYQGVLDQEQATIEGLGYAEFNPRSPKQKNEVFYNQLGFDPIRRKRKTKEGGIKQTLSVDKKALEKFSETSPLAKSLLITSEAQHQLNSFILPFERESVDGPSGHILYPSFNSVGPRTGRLSCSRPNLQNITSENSPLHKTDVKLRARECFIPRHGCAWMLADYSQIEIWVAAFLSKDPTMVNTLKEGKSVHDLTCDRVFGHKLDFQTNRPMYRKMAKIVTFSILYGSGPKALGELLGLSYDEAKVYYKNFWDTYQGLRRYADSLEKQVKEQGWVKDLFGRVYFIPKNQAYKSLNYIIQGAAAGVLKRAMLSLDAALKTKYPEAHMLMTIHDEVVVQGPLHYFSDEFVTQVVESMQGDFHTLFGMEKPFDIGVSFVTENWGTKFDYKKKA